MHKLTLIERRIPLPNDMVINVRYTEVMKPVVLFLHFSGGTSHIWDGVLPFFEQDYRIVAPDCRGHGKSDKPEIGYHIDDMANDMYLLLMELAVEQCHIVGSSMGAEVGLSLAAQHPEMVLSLVCEGALYNEFGEYGMFQGSEEEVEQEKARLQEQIAQRVVPICTTTLEYLDVAKVPFIEQGNWNSHFQHFLESTVMETEDGRFTSHYQNYVRSEYIQKYWDVRFEEYYKKVHCPILFLPSVEECADERIRSSLSVFSKLVHTHEIRHIENGNHAYVWMQLPEIAGETAKSFIDKTERNNR